MYGVIQSMRNMIKLFYAASILALSLFCFIGSSAGAASMLEGLSSFQESLAGWVEKVESLEGKLSVLEKDLGAKDKKLTDIKSSLSNIESLLSKLDSKITKVEKTRSVQGVRESLKSYEDILDIFKERFAEMAKKLEDQEVKVAVLEKIYATAQNPVETLLREMDKQKESINALAEKVDTQDKSLLVITEDFKKSKTPSETLEKRIKELQTRLSGLESGTVKRETGLVATEAHGTDTTEEASHSESHAGESEAHTVASRHEIKGGHSVKSGTGKKESPDMKGYIDIGEGFFIKDVKFASFGSSCQVHGEIVNKSERYYSTADFTIQAFNNVGKLLGGYTFSIMGFGQGRKEIFEEILTGVKEDEVTTYALSFGKGEMKMVERAHEVLVADAEAHKDRHEVAKRDAEKKEALEGFEDIGNGIYLGNVAFSGFGSSSTVTGVVKNQSGKDFERAAFVMKIFSKEYGMITKLEFAIRRLKAGGSRHFEEIITGVGPTDIDRYEVAFKESY